MLQRWAVEHHVRRMGLTTGYAEEHGPEKVKKMYIKIAVR